MKMVIYKPNKKFLWDPSHTHAPEYKELIAFYNNLEQVLKEEEISYKIEPCNFISPIKKHSNAIVLGFHIYDNPENYWTIKRGYLPGYLYFNRTGYSGWAECTYDKNKKYNCENLEEIKKYYIKNNVSKGVQPEGADKTKKPYILVLAQKPNDTVSKLAHIKTLDLSALVQRAYVESDYTVYTKQHPGANCLSGTNCIEGSLHTLIADADKIYTVNSGAGFEALLHGKHVFTSGKCEYQVVTTCLSNFDDILRTIDLPGPTQEEIDNYLSYCFTEFFVNAFDKESIRKKVHGCFI